MKWFDYLKKTPVVQIVADWRVYKNLRKALRQAEKNMVLSGNVLVRHYSMDDDIGQNNACIKSKQLVDGMEFFGEEPCRFYVQRCRHFAPEGNEQKCTNNLCVMHKENNVYCENKQKFNDLKMACSCYWTNKFTKVK